MKIQEADSDPSTPYFFLSYAHTPKHDPDLKGDPDKWVVHFFERLRRTVADLAEVAVARAGFMERATRPSNGWSDEARTALAGCRVLVPLFSRRYFTDEKCGKEWTAFTLRGRGRSARNTWPAEAIVPALWTPFPPADLPDSVWPVKFEPTAFGDDCGRLGFYGIIRSMSRDESFGPAVLRLAEQIVTAGLPPTVAPGRLADYGATRDAFTGSPHRRPLNVILALAPHRTASNWNPYGPRSAPPFSAFIEKIARNNGYEPRVGMLGERVEELWEVPPSAPGILVLDPHALNDEEVRDTLRRFDALDRPWIGLIIPWNPEEDEVPQKTFEMKRLLRDTMPRRHDRVSPASKISVTGISSLVEFGKTLPSVIGRVGYLHMSNVESHPPAAPGRAFPRLRGGERGAGTDRQAPEER